MRPEVWKGQTGEQISLRALVPQIQFSLDMNNATLNLAVPPHLFEPQTIVKEEPPTLAVDKEPLHPLALSSFLNYNIEANFSGEEKLTHLVSPWEIGVNWKQWFALSTFSSKYEVANHLTKTLRQNTSLYWDDVGNMRSLFLGDFTAPSSLLSGGGNFAGISWRKNFQLNPKFRYISDLSLETTIESPTHAQLYINGRSEKDWDLLPGMVSFTDISAYAGGDAELVLTDAFGREQRLTVPSNPSSQILKKGLHEYAYSLGWQRQNLGQASFDYGKLAFLGNHRYGFGETLTGGGTLAVTSDALAGGPMLNTLVGNAGQLEAGLVFSLDALAGNGHSATARYSYNYKNLNAYLSLTETSQNYTHVPSTAVAIVKVAGSSSNQKVNSQPHYQGSLNLNYTTPAWGNVSVTYTDSRNWNEAVASSRFLSFTYRKAFQSGLSLTLGLRHHLENQDDDEVYLTLQYFPKIQKMTNRIYDDLNLETRYHQTLGREEKINVQKSFPRGLGYGYIATLAEHDRNLSVNLYGQHQNERGIYTGTVNRSDVNQISGRVSVAGSLAMLDGKLYQGRPITDSFAVVRVEGLNAVAVESGGSPMGRTGKTGTLLVPDLSSYNNNKLSITALNLPMNYNLATSEQAVEVKQRSGSLVTFQVTHFTAVEGNLYLATTEDKKSKLEALPLEVVASGKKLDSFVGRNGYFYLENLPVGELHLRVRRAAGDCSVSVTLPNTDKVISNLGELACIPAP